MLRQMDQSHSGFHFTTNITGKAGGVGAGTESDDIKAIWRCHSASGTDQRLTYGQALELSPRCCVR